MVYTQAQSFSENVFGVNAMADPVKTHLISDSN